MKSAAHRLDYYSPASNPSYMEEGDGFIDENFQEDEFVNEEFQHEKDVEDPSQWFVDWNSPPTYDIDVDDEDLVVSFLSYDQQELLGEVSPCVNTIFC